MRLVVQRVSNASVTIDGKVVAQIGRGLLVLLGIDKNDTSNTNQEYLINKILKLRVFPDGDQSFHKSIVDIGGEVLLVSQFTLYGDCSNGNRPSFSKSMAPGQALQRYNFFAKTLRNAYAKVKEGVFGAQMQVALVNDGPATFIIEGR